VGRGLEVQGPLGMMFIGGALIATILTLFVASVLIYVVCNKIRKAMKNMRNNITSVPLTGYTKKS